MNSTTSIPATETTTDIWNKSNEEIIQEAGGNMNQLQLQAYQDRFK